MPAVLWTWCAVLKSHHHTHLESFLSNGRRQLFARAGAAVFSAGMVQGASAKAGQFGKVEIFGMGISSPFQPGGPKSGEEATYGYAKSSGPILAKGYEVQPTPLTALRSLMSITLAAIHSKSPPSLPPPSTIHPTSCLSRPEQPCGAATSWALSVLSMFASAHNFARFRRTCVELRLCCSFAYCIHPANEACRCVTLLASHVAG